MRLKKIVFATAMASVLLSGTLHGLAQEKKFSAADKLRFAEGIIQNYYVDDVDADSLVEEGIRAMLKTLDPHSTYTTPDETKALNEPLEGKFSGIGIQFNMSTDTVYVVQTISGGPSERVGILPGDRIIAADDSVIAGKKLPNSSILKILRGPKGSQVNLKVKRMGEPDLIDFVVVRDDIPINSVDAAYMVTPEIGFISLTRFAENSGEEVAEAIVKLQKQGMTKLILDLESNGGGYLGSAVDLASLFLDQGDMVVYTEGRTLRPSYYHVETPEPLFTGNVVVMVDQHSASASEITAGALQDNDRATIVGRRTFGKGLVQRPFTMPDGSMIRLTVSRYHTPTGRLIQKPYEKGKGEEYAMDIAERYDKGELWTADSIHFDESQKYLTLKKGRTVYGGGGIMPDVFVPVDTTYNSKYYRDLVARNILNPYVVGFIDSNRERLLSTYPTQDAFFEGFIVTPEMVEALVARGEAEGLERNDEQLQRSLPLIEAVLKGLLVRDLYEDGIYARAINPLNPTFNEALRVLQETVEPYADPYIQ